MFFTGALTSISISKVHLYSSVELVLHLYVLRDVSMSWRGVTSKEFLTINQELLKVK